MNKLNGSENRGAIGKETWKEVISKEHFDILAKHYKRGTVSASKTPEPNTKHLNELLRIIRNKYEHRNDVPLKDLGWIPENYDSFDDFYENFWCNYFPELLPYLWNTFGEKYAEDKSLKEFYPQRPLQSFPENMSKFLKNLDKALYKHLSKGQINFVIFSLIFEIFSKMFNVMKYLLVLGGLLDRYQTDESEKKIELRFLPSELPLTLVEQCFRVKIAVNPVIVKLYGSGFKGERIHKSVRVTLDCALVIVTETENLEKFLENVKNSARIVLMISNQFDVKKAREVLETLFNTPQNSLTRHPVNISDLKISDRVEVENNTTVDIQSRNTSIKLKDLMSKEWIEKHIVGESLNEVLRDKKLSLFSYKLPEMDKLGQTLYKRRKIFDASLVNVGIFLEADKLDSNKFVVSNISKQDIQSMLQEMMPKLAHITEWKSDEGKDKAEKSIFHTTDDIKEVCKNIEHFKGEANVHFFKYLGNTDFQWFQTIGSICDIQDTLSSAAIRKSICIDRAFLASLDNRRMVAIADQPGMGKSMVLLKLANQLAEMHTSRVTIFVELNKFAQELHSNLTKTGIIYTIVQLCSCSDMEHAFLKSYLKRSSANSEHVSDPTNAFGIELCLDGLDEVIYELKETAFKLIQLICKEIPFIRVWVTMRDHMIVEYCKEFGTLGYKLEPFSETLQVDYIEDYWNNYYLNAKETTPLKALPDDLESYAKKCIEQFCLIGGEDIAGVPLHCRIIAEIHEEQALSPDKRASPDSEVMRLHDLYEKFLSRKFTKYLEKTVVSISESHPLRKNIKYGVEDVLLDYSIKLLFKDESFPVDFYKKLWGHSAEEMQKIALVHGIVLKTEPLTFMHRTFAEYIVANDIFKAIISSPHFVLTKSDYPYRQLLSKYVYSNDEKIKNCYQNIQEFLNLMLWYGHTVYDKTRIMIDPVHLAAFGLEINLPELEPIV